jgi:hypothetical protein
VDPKAFCGVRRYLQEARLGRTEVLVRLFRDDSWPTPAGPVLAIGCRSCPRPPRRAPLSPARKADRDLDTLFEKITVDAYDDDKQFTGVR